METSVAVLSVGFLAQGFFSARVLVQWLLSERARSVLSPSVFWVLSVAGAWLLCVYGWLRGDFAIVMGQLLSYYIYLWNLKSKGVWAHWPLFARAVAGFYPHHRGNYGQKGHYGEDGDAAWRRSVHLCRHQSPPPRFWLQPPGFHRRGNQAFLRLVRRLLSVAGEVVAAIGFLSAANRRSICGK